MPRKPLKPCSYTGCPNLTAGQYCEKHRVTERRKYDRYQRDPEIVRQYRGAWRAIRERYIRSHPLCEDCLESGRLTPAAEVHHLLPLSRGGTHDEENLRALYRSCHNKRHIALGDR